MRCLGLFLFLSVLSITQKIYAQDSIYFNKIYNPNNTYAKGRCIVQIDDYYYCLFGTKSTNDIEIMMGLCKIDLNGSLIDYCLIGEANHHYYPGNVGGTLIKTNDGNLAFATHIESTTTVYSTLVKLNTDLDTIWKRDYYLNDVWAIITKAKQTSDKGYLLIGAVNPGINDYSDLLIIKTDSLGNKLWHQSFGSLLSEYGTDINETPNGGYLLGGFRYDPAVYHSLDALVIKTDSLGNEEWTKTFGNPNVDDDMAHVALADDGNYLVATVYGEWQFGNESRIGKQCIYKVNQQGQIIDTYYPGVSRLHNFIRNLRRESDGYIMTGFSYETDTVTAALYTGWMMKLDYNLDSVWYRDYTHFNQLWDDNYLYDINACEDNGYIAIGEAHPDMGSEKLWVIKVDSMGCDTAGCATGTWISELSPSGVGQGEDLRVFPNPANEYIIFQLINFSPITMVSRCQILIANSYGQPITQIPITGNKTFFDCSHLSPGIYFYQFQTNQKTYSGKFLKTN
jgi:hypothetical protein